MLIASFYGSRNGAGPLRPHYLRFDEAEVRALGVTPEPCPAEPPWPPEYSDAHHELHGDSHSLSAVAHAMAARHTADPARAVSVSYGEMLAGVAALLGRADVHPDFRDSAMKRMRRVFKLERDLWLELAAVHPHLLEDPEVQRAIRDLFNKQRMDWNRIAAALPRVVADPLFSKGPPRTRP